MYDPTPDKIERPETIGEAIADDRRTAAYRRAGLCPQCSSHLSKGHAYGFTRIPRSPCDQCSPIVATFPEPTASPSWRKWPRGRVGRPSTRTSAVRGVTRCPIAADDVARAQGGVD